MTEFLPLGEALNYPTFREGLKRISEQRRQAVKNYAAQGREAAKAEATYQVAKAQELSRLIHKEKLGATEAKEALRGQQIVAEAQIERDTQQALLRAALEDIATLDAERASLHRIGEWSMKGGHDG